MRTFGLRRKWVSALGAALVFAALMPSPPSAATGRTTTISVPRTLAGAATLGAGTGRVNLSFPATHIVFSWEGPEGGHIRYRLTSPEGDRGSWKEAVEGGEHSEDGRHHSAVTAIPRATAIEYRAVSPNRKPLTDVRLDHMNTIDGPSEIRTIPVAPRTTAAGTPQIVTRAQWGADERIKGTKGSCKRTFYPVQQIFVHHTAGSNSDANPAATMRAIYQYHVGSRGWCDIGYNFVIGRDGTVFEGRWARNYAPWEVHTGEDVKGNAVSGAHVSGFNSGSVGVSLMGNFETGRVPTAMKQALIDFLAWESDRHDLSPRSKHTYRNPDTGTTKRLPYIAGHRNAGYTSCPGANLYRLLPDIRAAVAERVGAGKPSSDLTLTTPERKVTYGTDVPLSGFLKVKGGGPLSGRTVILHRKNGRGSKWFVERNLLTDLNGAYSLALTPERNTKMRARFPDAPDVWGSQSYDLRVKVRHLASLRGEGGAPDPSGSLIYPAGTTSVTLSGSGAPVHQARTVKVHVWRINPDGSSKRIHKAPMILADDGTYRLTVDLPPGTGTRTFTAVTWYPKDSGHLAGRSETLRFVVPG